MILKIRFTNYIKCVEYLYDLERAGIKYDLKNTRAILRHLNNPHKEYKSIHIAGTNGKGSVAAILNSVFIEKGFKTGLYTSPHIHDFRERILVNGRMISRKFILDFTNKHYELIEKIKPSFYEISTALAFEYFHFKKVKYAIVETGLGGRLDSTNVLKPILSIITGISIDHTEFLGDTLKSIAEEKAGIVKQKTPCVLGAVSSSVKKVFSEKCKSKNSELIYAPEYCNIKIYNKNESGFTFDYILKSKSQTGIKYPLIGNYQIKNICTSLATLNKISELENTVFSDSILFEGFGNIISNSNFYGRFQLLGKRPSVVIDVSHNIEGLSNIQSNLEFFNFDKVIVIFALMKDKKYKKCLEEIEKINVTTILTKPKYKRTIDPIKLHKLVKNKENFIIKEDIEEAFLHSKKNADKNDLILITGSFFLVGEFWKVYNGYFKSN